MHNYSHPVMPTDAMLDAHLKGMSDALLNANQKIVFIFDLNKAKLLTADHRVKAGKWYNENKKLFDDKCLGIAAVNTNILINIMLKGIFLITGNNTATIFSKMESAKEWADQLLAKNAVKA
jgi:hypothetical protein